MMIHPFTEADMEDAANDWGANCGPSALAFFLQVPLNHVRSIIPGFEEKGFTSPTMMKQALVAFDQPIVACDAADKHNIFSADEPCLVRIQWTGPWTKPGANPKWAYRQTHWICTYMVERQAAMVFDCNGGVRGYQSWMREIVPLIVQSVPRADGDWFPTHVWRRAQ